MLLLPDRIRNLSGVLLPHFAARLKRDENKTRHKYKMTNNKIAGIVKTTGLKIKSVKNSTKNKIDMKLLILVTEFASPLLFLRRGEGGG